MESRRTTSSNCWEEARRRAEIVNDRLAAAGVAGVHINEQGTFFETVVTVSGTFDFHEASEGVWA